MVLKKKIIVHFILKRVVRRDYKIAMIKKVFSFIIIAVLFGADTALAAGCAVVGKKIASQENGVLVRLKPVVHEGKDMCMVVVIVPAHDGEKLRRVEVFVPSD